MPPRSRISLSAYRPRPGREAELVASFAGELAVLRAGGHVTERPAPVCRTESGEYLVILEWATETSAEDAHRDPKVLEEWARKGELAEYLGHGALSGSDRPFMAYELIGDA